jgi:phospholipid N-methyltransferase
MPDLSTNLHVSMLRSSKRANALPRRIANALRRSARPWVYGTEWGDIEDVPPLARTLQRWVTPYVDANQVAVEIGPGGGRWTRHLLGFSKLYVVEYYDEVRREFERNFGGRRNLSVIKNNGSDFPGIPPKSVDFCFSFGVFVHLETHIIEKYLENIKTIIKDTGNVVLHYSDMNKIMAQENEGFSQNTPEIMRQLVQAKGYRILEEDTTTLWHSSLIRIGLDLAPRSNARLA